MENKSSPIAGFSCEGPGPDRPGVVLIQIDGLRQDVFRREEKKKPPPLLSASPGGGRLPGRRFLLNAAWLHNSEAAEGERDDHYKIIVGYNRRMNADTIPIFDYVREQEKEEDKDTNLVEAGLR